MNSTGSGRIIKSNNAVLLIYNYLVSKNLKILYKSIFVIQNIIWGQKGNFLDVPTDCPQRDERQGWTGDATVFSKTASYNYDVETFFEKWLTDLRLDQGKKGNKLYRF